MNRYKPVRGRSLHTIEQDALNGDEESRHALKTAANELAFREYRETLEGALEAFRGAVVDEPERDPNEVLSEVLDGYFVYQKDALAYLSQTPNPDHYANQVGEAPPSFQVQAVYALEADLLYEVWREGEGFSDLEAWAKWVRQQATGVQA